LVVGIKIDRAENRGLSIEFGGFMKTKTEILAMANAELAIHYNWIRDHNPTLRLPALVDPPTVTRVILGEISHRYGTEADLTLSLRFADGRELQAHGAYFDNHHGSESHFTSLPSPTKEYMEAFVTNLFGNIAFEEGVEEFTDWDRVPD
jgi:hypothetical protein